MTGLYGKPLGGDIVLYLFHKLYMFYLTSEVFKENFGVENYDFITLMPVWLSWCAWHFCKGMDLLPLHCSHLSSLAVSYVILLTSIFQTCISQLVCHRRIWNTQQKDLRFYKTQAYMKRILDKKNITFLNMLWKIMFVRDWMFYMPWYIHVKLLLNSWCQSCALENF